MDLPQRTTALKVRPLDTRGVHLGQGPRLVPVSKSQAGSQNPVDQGRTRREHFPHRARPSLINAIGRGPTHRPGRPDRSPWSWNRAAWSRVSTPKFRDHGDRSGRGMIAVTLVRAASTKLPRSRLGWRLWRDHGCLVRVAGGSRIGEPGLTQGNSRSAVGPLMQRPRIHNRIDVAVVRHRPRRRRALGSPVGKWLPRG
jgi:hypothetical protein